MRRAWVIAVAVAGCSSPPRQDSSSPFQELAGLARDARSIEETVNREVTLKQVATVQAQVGDVEGSIASLSAIADWPDRFSASMGIILYAKHLQRVAALRLLAFAREVLEPPADPESAGFRERSYYAPMAIGYARWNQDREALWALGNVGTSIRDWVVAAQAICQEQVWGGRPEAAITLAESPDAFEPQELFEVIALELANVGRPREGLNLADRAGEARDWVRFRCLLKIPDLAAAAEAMGQLRDSIPEARVELALAYAVKGEIDAAKMLIQQACDEVLDRKDELESIWKARAEFRFALGDLEGALDDCESGFPAGRARYGILREFGRQLIAQGKLDRAAALIPMIGDHGTAMRLGDLALARWRRGERDEAKILIHRAIERLERFLATWNPHLDPSVLSSENSQSACWDLSELLGILGTIDPRLLVDRLPRWQNHLDELQVCEMYRAMGRNRPAGVAPVKLSELPLDRRTLLRLGMMEARLGFVP